jgi:hypothetical protein
MQRDQDDVALSALPIGVGCAAGRCRSYFFPPDIHSFFLYKVSIIIICVNKYEKHLHLFRFISKHASFATLVASSGTPKPLRDDGSPPCATHVQ